MDENYNKKHLLYKQKRNIFYYDIAVSLPWRQCFTYKSVLKIKKGVRVSIPFGNRKVIGVVVKKIDTPAVLNKTGTIKRIISILDEYSIFDNPSFKTILWASDYYHHPLGEVFHSFIPALNILAIGLFLGFRYVASISLILLLQKSR